MTLKPKGPLPPTSGVRTHVTLVVELGGTFLLLFNDLQKLAWIGWQHSQIAEARVRQVAALTLTEVDRASHVIVDL